MIRFLTALALLFAIPAFAQQPIPIGGGGGSGGSPCYYPVGSSSCTFSQGVSVSGAPGYQLNGTTAFNTLANTGSPILSPETANTPLPASYWITNPIGTGYAASWSATTGKGVYASTNTAQLTINGSPTVHWGMYEDTMTFAVGTGDDMGGESNVRKEYMLIPSGVTVGSNETLELMPENAGTTGTLQGGIVNPVLDSGSTTTNVYGWNGWVTNNTGNGGKVIMMYHCAAGTGSTSPTVGYAFCIGNEDPNQDFLNEGHYVSRPVTGNVPTLTDCGTTPTLSAASTDTSGTITEGTGSPTGCVLTFKKAYSINAPTAIVTAPDGIAATSYSISTTALTIVNSAANGDTFSYIIMGGH